MTYSVPDWLREELAKRQAELETLPDTPYNVRQKASIDRAAEMVAVIDQSTAPQAASGAAPALSAAACRHPNLVDVRSIVTDELLARLCPDCDAQLPAGHIAQLP